MHQRRARIARRSGPTQAVDFFNVLTSQELLETTESLLPEHRKSVNGWAAQGAADGLRACSVRTGGYCRARQRLPLQMVKLREKQERIALACQTH